MLPFVIATWITLAVIALMIAGLLQERLSPDTLVLGALVLLMLFGIVDPGSALRGLMIWPSPRHHRADPLIENHHKS